MKIGNTSFNDKSIKEMSFKEFEKIYKSLVKDPKKVYEAITGKKVVEETEIANDKISKKTKE